MQNFIRILLIALFFPAVSAFAQKGILIYTHQEISLLVENAEGKYVENIILQVEKNDPEQINQIQRIDELVYSYDGKTLVIQMEDGPYTFTIDENLKGENLIYGYGISRKYGDLKFKENLLEKGGVISAFDLVYIVGQSEFKN